jgi:ATP/maltotriose-dependent transcriptional regulator MalT
MAESNDTQATLAETDDAPMPGQVDLECAEQALASGDWRSAADLAQRSLAASDTGEAHALLAVALWCGYDTAAALDEMKLAYRLLVDTGMVRRAAYPACFIGVEEALTHGDRAVASGWLARSARLLEDLPECFEQGWLLLYRAYFEGDYQVLAAAASQAQAVAQRCGSRDLEISARAGSGYAQVLLGNVKSGMALLDEAMAGVTSGDTTAPLVIGDCFCVTLAACESAHDYARAEEWCRIGLASAGDRTSGFLKANCLASYGWILGVLGRTSEGEARLRAALAMFNTGHWRLGHRHILGNVLVKLADLQRRRGNTAAAGTLLLEGGESAEALHLRGELALDAGEAAAALSLARDLEEITRGGQDTRRVMALQLLVRAAATAGEAKTAARNLAELEALAGRLPPSRSGPGWRSPVARGAG